VHAEPGEVQKLAPGVFVWQGDRDKREPANCMWVIFKDYVVVIDANFPWAAREILARIKETTDKPIRYVLNTHYHSDHSFGNSIFTDAGATIVNSEATDAENRASKGFAAWNDAAHPLTGAHQEYANITFSDRLVFDDGTQRVEMIRLGPAHSKGDSVAYLPKQKIVATGDLCVTWGFGNNVGDPGASYAGWLSALDRMVGWQVQKVVPGHGAVSGLEALRVQRDYLSAMRDQIQDGMRAGKSADQLATEVDLRKYGFIASDRPANETSVRAMYRHLGSGNP
jgi:glyoxylase-like metal-dependent hydrolase (beta-lactamase superfamily II)